MPCAHVQVPVRPVCARSSTERQRRAGIDARRGSHRAWPAGACTGCGKGAAGKGAPSPRTHGALAAAAQRAARRARPPRPSSRGVCARGNRRAGHRLSPPRPAEFGPRARPPARRPGHAPLPRAPRLPPHDPAAQLGRPCQAARARGNAACQRSPGSAGPREGRGCRSWAAATATSRRLGRRQSWRWSRSDNGLSRPHISSSAPVRVRARHPQSRPGVGGSTCRPC